MKPQFRKLYMDLAIRIAKMSHAKRKKVGCVVVKDDNIVSFSWNGTPPGFDNDCEDLLELHEDGTRVYVTKPLVQHSEANAIHKAARAGISLKGSSMFITLQPCMECAKGIYMSGVSEVIYKEKYRDKSGVEFLEEAGVKVTKYEEIVSE